MIKLEHVSKKYGHHTIFNDVNITFVEQKNKIKGENGVGKSVLLKLIVGYSVPDQGDIYYNTTMKLRKKSDFIEQAGVSINAPEFMKQWTGLENLTYLANINNTCSKERLQTLIKTFSLEKDIHKKVKTYSLGMKQKMRLIQALIDTPKYLILDEPFDALDKQSKEIAKNFLDDYLKEDPSRILIYTSHSEADDIFADRLYVIDEQRVEAL
ncbi:MAG: ATP-binding cassette domain-containing protein [Erysipelotrichaceae bacterium]